MKRPPEPLEEPRWQQRMQARLTALFSWLGRKVNNSRMKEITLLTLPYQVAAVITALIAVGYAKLFDLVEQMVRSVMDHHADWIFWAAPLGFLASWFIVRRFAPLSGGSGIPQLMAAIEIADDKTDNDRSWRFLNVRIIVVKIASSLAMALGAGALGREGPTLQIAGSVYRVVHKLLPPFWPKISRRAMMITGGAAGLSAAFNTPLGGIVFAVEELTKTHIAQFRTAVLTSVIIAGMTAQQLMGGYFGSDLLYPKVDHVGPGFMYQVLPIAMLAGGCGALFCKVLLLLDKWRRDLGSAWSQAVWVLVCAFAFAACTRILGPQVIGSGKLVLRSMLFDSEAGASWRDVAARTIGPILSFGTGGAGGLFAPALSGGAAIGSWVGQFFNPTAGELRLLTLAGMVAFMTGVSRSPFTSAILVLEMTDRHSVIFQLMYAAMVAYMIAYTIDKRPYYERMKERLLKAIGMGVSVRKPSADDDPSDQPAGYGLG